MQRVIFDTNAYRDLITDKTFEEIDEYIDIIKAKEAEENISTMFSPIVAQELLAHIADKNDWAYDVCLRANKAMYLHNGDLRTVSIFPTFETLLAKMYFNDIPARRVEYYDALAQMCMHLALNPNEATFATFNEKLQYIKDLVCNVETTYVDTMFDYVKIVDPTATDWRPFRNDEKQRKKLLEGLRSASATYGIAKGYVYMAHVALAQSGHDKIYTPEQIDKMTNDVAEKFPEPIELFKSVIENMTNSDFPLDQKSRANFVWDVQLMFGAGKHFIGNNKLYFVTADKAIIRAAIQQGSGTSVYNLKDYLEFLGI